MGEEDEEAQRMNFKSIKDCGQKSKPCAFFQPAVGAVDREREKVELGALLGGGNGIPASR